MKLAKDAVRLYAVTDRSWLNNKTLAKAVEEAILGGVTFVQLREKSVTKEEFIELAREVKEVTDRYKVPFVINDHVDVALEVDADGVHVGQDDDELTEARRQLGPDKLIGVSTHNVEEALQAEKNGADYIGVGAVFGSSTKLDAGALTHGMLQKVANAVTIPVVGIGGINERNLMQLNGSGIDGVAVISALFAKEDITAAASELRQLADTMVASQKHE